MGGGGVGPRLPLAADRDGVLWLLFCVLVACGVGGYFVALSLVADSVCELCVVIAGWRASSAVWDDLIEFAAEWVWCFEREVDGFAAECAGWYWSLGRDVSGFAFAAGCSVLVSARTCLVAHDCLLDEWIGGLGGIRIRGGPTSVGLLWSRPSSRCCGRLWSLPYASRGIRGWLRSSDLRFWRLLLYLLSYAHRWSCRLIAMAHDHWVDMGKAPEAYVSEAFALILTRSIPRGGGSLLLLGFCVSRVRCFGGINVESWTWREPRFRGC